MKRSLVPGFALILVGLGALVAGVAFAHVPIAGSTSSTGYGSIFPHQRTTRIQIMGSLQNWSFMTTDYNNARGHLSQELDGHLAGNPVWQTIPLGGSPEPDVWVVEAGSTDEAVLNWSDAFPACSSSTAWGQVRAIIPYGNGSHWHSVRQKICIWPSRIGTNCGGRLGTNSQGLRWQYLTLEHEMAHVLTLADHTTTDHNALMRSGCGMTELSTGPTNDERAGIRNHY